MKKIKQDNNMTQEISPEPQMPASAQGYGEVKEPKKAVFQKEGELVCDVYETPAEFVIMSAIAGVVIKDIDISIKKDMMIIRGERKDPNQIEGKKYLYQECYFGPFSKKVILPDNIKLDEASAEMDKGVLTIKFPKTEKNGNGKEKIGIKTA